MADVVRELAARLSLQVDRASFKAGDAAIGQTKSTLGSIPTAAAGAFAAAAAMALEAKKHFIDFNSNIEQSVISLAAVQKMFKGTEWGESMATAGKLVEHYQEVAKASVGETKDFIEMHKSIAASAYQAGANLEDLKEITRGAVIASSAMGESAIVSAMDVKQALSKGVSVRDRFMVNLLAAEKVTTARFNAMSKQDRVATLKKALTADWIKDASKQMEGSWAGVTSTMKDTISITLGKVGLPLFKSMTAEVAKWNKYLSDPNNAMFALVSRNVSEFGAAFKMVASTASAVVGLLEMLNRQVTRLKGSSVGEVFKAIASPIETAYNTVRDLADYFSGEASALGLSRAIARGEGQEYMAHAQKGGKFTTPGLTDGLGGRIVPLGQQPVSSPRKVANVGEGIAGGTLTAQSIARASEMFKAGRGDEGIMAALGAIATLPVSGMQMGYNVVDMGRQAIARPKSPWADIPYSPDVKVSPESLASMPEHGWTAPPPILASGLASVEPPPTKLAGEVKINVKVNVPNLDAQVEKSLQSIWREGNELYSSEPGQ
jgi:hypothetical protein